MIEEVARIHGIHHIPTTLPKLAMAAPTTQSSGMIRYRNADRARTLCASLGLSEVLLFSMTSPERVRLGEGSQATQPLRIDNPLREELSVLRTKLLPGLVDLLRQNLAHGQTDIRLFEVGEVFLPSSQSEQLPTEKVHVAGVLCGHRDFFLKPSVSDVLDFYDVKGLVDQLVIGLGLQLTWQPLDKVEVRTEANPRAVFIRSIPEGAKSDENKFWHPGATAELVSVESGEVLGVFGELHPDLRQSLDLPSAAFAFELEVPGLPIEKQPYVAPSRFPATSRDLSFFVDRDVEASRLLSTMEKSSEPLLRGVALLEDYRQPGHVPAGQKALLFSLTYRADDRTLTDEEVQKAHQKVIEHLRLELQRHETHKIAISLRQ